MRACASTWYCKACMMCMYMWESSVVSYVVRFNLSVPVLVLYSYMLSSNLYCSREEGRKGERAIAET